MDAIHLMRAITGRDLIIKMEGCYHGHHDSVQVSVAPEADEAGPEGKPAQAPSSTGIPGPFIKLTLVASFNDIDSVARLLDEHPDEIAGMIIEPIMMNAGIIHPEPGYLAALKDLLHSHGALLTFDEVKTGLTAGPAGATGLTGVVPDITCLAKAIGGGVAIAAIGGTAEVMAHVAAGDYEMVGTFNGNPLALAAARAMLHRGRDARGLPADRRPGRAGRLGHRARDRRGRAGRPRGDRGCQGLRGVLRPAGPGLPRLPGHRRPLQPGPLAVPAQRWRLPPALGQDRTMAHLGAAR